MDAGDRRDGRPGQWYLHLFTPEQPDLDWTNPEVRDEFDDTMRFWFELGVDGFRIDVAHGLVKAEGLPDIGSIAWPPVSAEHGRPSRTGTGTTFTRSTGLARARRQLRRPARVRRRGLGAQPGAARRCTSATTSFTPRSTSTSCSRPGTPRRFATSIVAALSAHEAVGAPATWVLSNHDTVREVSRYARPQGVAAAAQPRRPARPAGRLRARRPPRASRGAADARAARRRVRLPGRGARARPRSRTCPTTCSRIRAGSSPAAPSAAATAAGCRSRGRASRRRSASAPTARPRRRGCPQPASWRDADGRGADRRRAARCSSSTAARSLFAATHPALGDGTLRWLDAPDGALAFARDPGFACVVNMSAEPWRRPRGADLLLCSGRSPTTAASRPTRPRGSVAAVSVGFLSWLIP